MVGFAYRVAEGKAERLPVEAADRADGDLVWIHLATTGDHGRDWLESRAHVPAIVVEAMTASETRPRCEAIGDGAFLNLRGRTDEEIEGSDMLASLRLWATRGRIVSATRKHLLATDIVEAQMREGRITDPGDLITAFATAITADLDPEVAALGDELDDCEEQLDPNKVFELRRGVTRVRVAAIGYRRFLAPQRAALERLAALPGGWLEEGDRQHLATAADQAARMVEELEAIRERAALMHEALTDLRAEQLDTRGLVISVAALVFLPLTFITGLYGMNVEGLWFARQPWAFDAIVVLCAAIALIVTAFFLRRHWFRS